MAKHRELAQVMYATTLGRASASRIWRTVVVAGAMLGAPAVVSADTKAPAKPAESMPAPPPVKPDEPAPSKADVAKSAKETVKAVQAEIKNNDKTIADTTAALKKAKDEAERTTLTATLDGAKKHKDELKEKLATAQAESKKADAEAKAEADKNKPRPRTTANRKPIGRGFILA